MQTIFCKNECVHLNILQLCRPVVHTGNDACATAAALADRVIKERKKYRQGNRSCDNSTWEASRPIAGSAAATYLLDARRVRNGLSINRRTGRFLPGGGCSGVSHFQKTRDENDREGENDQDEEPFFAIPAERFKSR